MKDLKCFIHNDVPVAPLCNKPLAMFVWDRLIRETEFKYRFEKKKIQFNRDIFFPFSFQQLIIEFSMFCVLWSRF